VHALLSVLIFAGTLGLILWRPKRVGPGAAALGGALVAWATGVVTTADVVRVVGMTWNATLALVGLMIVSLLLDRAGFFQWAALHLARQAGGSGGGLFLVIALLCAVVAGVLTNDSAVLILTPIVYELLQALGFRRANMLPYLMASGFIADTMSLPLPVSNLTNILAADHYGLTASEYIPRMLLPTVVSFMASLGMLWWVYRKQIPVSYHVAVVPQPKSAIADPPLFYTGAVVLVLLLAAIGLQSVWALPISAIMGAGALVMLLATRIGRTVAPGEVLRRAPWEVVIFSLGMYLVVYGLRHVGVPAALGALFGGAAAQGSLAAILTGGTVVGMLSAGVNNLPGLLVGMLGIDSAGVAGGMQHLLVLSAVIGADIGPKLTPIGSLATLMWLHYLRYKGVQIDWKYLLRMGLTLTPPVLLATLLALWLAA
jgi:arsenical pump membrane protein